jgi:hypothetical protein
MYPVDMTDDSVYHHQTQDQKDFLLVYDDAVGVVMVLSQDGVKSKQTED